MFLNDFLITEICNFLNDFSLPMRTIFFENCYSLRKPRSMDSKWKNFTTTYGIGTISFRGPQTWRGLPQDIKNSDSSNFFKFIIKRYGT